MYRYRESNPDCSLVEFGSQAAAREGIDPASFKPLNLLEPVNRCFGRVLTPTCAVIGGMVAQETIKLVQAVSAPWSNVFLLDGREGGGVLETLQ